MSSRHDSSLDLDVASIPNVQQADRLIEFLTHDIGLILVQLAEDREAWCQRTGRSTSEHASWRRRALFAKAYKEQQLRECKRMRQRMLAEPAAARASSRSAPDELRSLEALCRRVVVAWNRQVAGSPGEPVGDAIMALAARIGEPRDSLELRSVSILS